MEIYEMTIHQIRKLIEKGDITAQEVTEAYYNRIDNVESDVKSFISLTREKAEAQLDNLSDKKGILAGMPVGLKDNISTEGILTTCGSKMLEDYCPPYNATVTNKLQDAGAIFLGKTNMDEFAMGSSTENSFFHNTHNPWDLDYAPGGSSGGSAAAVAAGEVVAALGSDTGGSIRQPASYCGVVGFKPTYGSVSRYGLVAFASSLDQIGPITKDVTDSAIMMNVITGHDPHDSTSVNQDYPDYTDFLKEDVKGMKIGLPAEYFDIDFDNEVKESVLAAVKKLEDAGAEVEEVHLTGAEYALAAYYVIAPAEASSNLARYDGVRYGYRSEKDDDIKNMFTHTRHEGFGPEVKRRIMLGTYALSSGYYDAFYLKAQKVRTIIKEDFDNLFKDYDLIISPTAPTTAFKLGEKKDPLEMYHADIFTVPVNIAGVPAISIPAGFDSKGLPIGLQMIGPHFGEGKILQAAYTLEKILDINKKRVKL